MMPIKINCRKVYETGINYQSAADKVKENQNNLENIASEISGTWTGGDSNNFLASFNEHIKSLEPIEDFLDSNGAILKGDALDHNIVDNDFSERMKRSEIYEKH